MLRAWGLCCSRKGADPHATTAPPGGVKGGSLVCSGIRAQSQSRCFT